MKIDCIVCGICCLCLGLEGISDNIKVVSIVGCYLEYFWIFYFYNKGKEEVYIGFVDWMFCNFDCWVEVIIVVEDFEIVKEL